MTNLSGDEPKTLIDVIDASDLNQNTGVEMTIELKSMEIPGVAIGVHDYIAVSIGVQGQDPNEIMQIHGVPVVYNPENGSYSVGVVSELFETSDKLVVVPSEQDYTEIKNVGSAVLFQTSNPAIMAAKIDIISETMSVINDKNLDYNPLMQNSNSVARALSEVLMENPSNVPDIAGIEVGNQTQILSDSERAEILSKVYNQPAVNVGDPYEAIKGIDREKIVEAALASHVKAISMEGMGEPDVAGDAGLAVRAAVQAGVSPSVVAVIAPSEPAIAPAITNDPAFEQQTVGASAPKIDFNY